MDQNELRKKKGTERKGGEEKKQWKWKKEEVLSRIYRIIGFPGETRLSGKEEESKSGRRREEGEGRN